MHVGTPQISYFPVCIRVDLEETEKMRNASGHQCNVKMSGSEKKVSENTYDISPIKRVTKKFVEISRCSRAKQRQRNVQKSVLHVQSCFFAN